MATYTKNHASGGTLCGKGKRCGPTGWYPMKWRTDWVRSVALRLTKVITCLYGFNPFNYIINGVTPSKAQCKTRCPEKYHARDLCVRPNDQRAESVAVTSKLLDHASWLDRWHSNIWAGSRRITDWKWFRFFLVSSVSAFHVKKLYF